MVRQGLLWVTVLVAATTVGCADPTGPTLPVGLEGSWSWVSSIGGIAGTEVTPTSSGQTLTLTFDFDGRARAVRDGTAGEWTTVVVEDAEDGVSFTVTYEDSPFGFPIQTGHFPEPDVLVLTDGCCDGFEHRFERIP